MQIFAVNVKISNLAYATTEMFHSIN